MADTYPLTGKGAASDPAIDGIPIDFSGGDQTFSVPITGLYITTAGTLKVLTAKGNERTFAVITGLLPLRITKIFQTGSSSVVGLALE